MGFTLKNPLVSVIVVNWNYGAFVSQTLKSVKTQTYPNWECIVVDNGSSDDSLQVIRKSIARDSRFRLIALRENLGHLGGCMLGLDEARGEFINFLDADDVLFPDFVSFHVQAHLAAIRPTAFTSSGVLTINAEGDAIGGNTTVYASQEPNTVPALPSSTHYRLAQAQVSDAQYEALQRVTVFGPAGLHHVPSMPGSSNIFRRQLLEWLRPAKDAPLPFGGTDAYFCFALHTLTGVTVLAVPLSAYRVHGKNDYTTVSFVHGLAGGNLTAVLRNRNVQKLAALTVIAKTQKMIELVGHRYFEMIEALYKRVTSDSFIAQYQSPRLPEDLQEVIAAEYALLSKAFGETVVLSRLRKIFGLSGLANVLRLAHPDGLPLRLRVTLFTARWYKW